MAGASFPDHRFLPEWLRERAERGGSAPALRYKRRGLWLEQSWSALAASVAATASLLREQGFTVGDRLLVDAAPVPAVFRHCLAAWWLGGGVVVIEPGAPPAQVLELARFALAGSELARARLEAAQPVLGPYALALQLEGGATFASGSWRSSDALATAVTAADAVPLAGEAVALVSYTAAARGAAAERRSVTHAELVDNARALLEGGATGTSALAGHGLSLGAQLETVLGAWLVGGFSLGFVEAEGTEHGDRRELEPALLFDTAAGYAALAARIEENLPPPESRERRWLDRALAGAPRLVRHLIASRLRAVVGFGRVRRAVLVGGTSDTNRLERLLGISLLRWPPLQTRRTEEAAEQSPAPLGALELARTGSDA